MDFSKQPAGTKSIKVRQTPGGQSSFSLAWDTPADTKDKITPKPNTPAQVLKESNTKVVTSEAKTSVKVHNPPGGRSNIIFG
jgi:hypothetical protein